MCVLIHIGFHNVVLWYYKIHDIINPKLPTLKLGMGRYEKYVDRDVANAKPYRIRDSAF